MKDFTGHPLCDDPRAARAMKKPVLVRAEFAESDGVLQTPEGAVRYLRGDALLTNSSNERWPVPRARFLETYEPTDASRPEAGGEFRKRAQNVWARKMDEAFLVRVGHA